MARTRDETRRYTNAALVFAAFALVNFLYSWLWMHDLAYNALMTGILVVVAAAFAAKGQRADPTATNE